MSANKKDRLLNVWKAKENVRSARYRLELYRKKVHEHLSRVPRRSEETYLDSLVYEAVTFIDEAVKQMKKAAK